MSDNDQILEQVIDVVEGRVQGADAEEVMARVAADARWHEAYLWASGFIADARSTTLQPVPASTRAMLERLLPGRSSFVNQVNETARTFARLVRDVNVGQAFAGARGASGTRRQLMFELVAGTDLAIELEAAGDTVTVSGQVLGDHTEATIEATSDRGVDTVSIDEVGEFVLTTPITAFLYLDIAAGDERTTVDLTSFLDQLGTPS